MTESEVIKATRSGAGWIFVNSIFKKIISFALNQALIRQARPDVIGAAEIQLELLLATLLFLSRESVRIACMRIDGKTANGFRKIINFSWIPAFILLIVLIANLFIHFTWSEGVDPIVVKLYVFGAFFEACGEPWHNSYRNGLLIHPGVNADTASVLIRSITAVFCVNGYIDIGIVGYGVAQTLHGLLDLIILVGYSLYTPVHGRIHSLTEYLPSISYVSDSDNSLSKRVTALIDKNFGITNAYLVFSSFSTCLLKHLLTQSDKIVLTLTASSFNQGIYAVIFNYVSFAARTLFYPLEETCRLAFSKLSVAKGDEKATAFSNIQQLLNNVLLLTSLFAVLFIVFGINYSSVFVNVFMGQQWRNDQTVTVLQYFCVYTAVMGFNGITEAFVYGTAPAEAYQTIINYGLISSSVVFTACIYMGSGSTSVVVIANTIAMLVRVGFSAHYIFEYFKANGSTFGVSSGSSKKVVLFVVTMSVLFAMLYFSKRRYEISLSTSALVKHIGVGCVGGIVLLAAVFAIAKKEMLVLISMLKR